MGTLPILSWPLANALRFAATCAHYLFDFGDEPIFVAFNEEGREGGGGGGGWPFPFTAHLCLRCNRASLSKGIVLAETILHDAAMICAWGLAIARSALPFDPLYIVQVSPCFSNADQNYHGGTLLSRRSWALRLSKLAEYAESSSSYRDASNAQTGQESGAGGGGGGGRDYGSL